MFRVIGGAVVYGLALYGVAKLFDRQKANTGNPPGARQDEKCRSQAPAAGSEVGGQSADQAGER